MPKSGAKRLNLAFDQYKRPPSGPTLFMHRGMWPPVPIQQGGWAAPINGPDVLVTRIIICCWLKSNHHTSRLVPTLTA